MSTYILDTETTGLAKVDQVIELGWYKADSLAEEFDSLQTSLGISNLKAFTTITGNYTNVTRYRPNVAINQRAYDVHQIGLSQLVDKPRPASITLPTDIKYIVGHNIVFDKRMLIQSNPSLTDQLENVKYICTKDLATQVKKFLNLEYPNVTLSGLVEFYFPDHVDSLVTPVHTAKGDVIKTLLVVLKIVEHLPNLETWDCIYNFLESMKKVKKK